MNTENLRTSKIVILVSAFSGDGAERQAYLLAREWRERHGLDVEVWALWQGEHTKMFESAGIPIRALCFTRPRCPVRWVRGIYWVRRLSRVIRQLKERRVDILLPFGGWPNVVAAFTYRLAGIKLCIWGERPMGRARGERLAVKRCRHFVANSPMGVESLNARMHVPMDRIALIPNGVEEPEGKSLLDMKVKLGLEPEQLLVAKVAVIDATRDHATLLHAWKIVQEMWPQPQKPVLALAGSLGETQAECRQIVRKAGLQSTVHFLGAIPHVPALIASADLAVYSTKTDAMPNAVLECMIAGKSVVASDVPGLRDMLPPNVAEVLVPPCDSKAFARAILALLHDAEKRKAIGDSNRAWARARFPISQIADEYLRLMQGNWPAARLNPDATSGTADLASNAHVSKLA